MKTKRLRRALPLLLALFVMLGAISPVYAASGGTVAGGSTYFTGTDNWGGGPLGTEAADGDIGIPLKNQNKSGADNYSKYPIEFKIENVTKLPTTTAHLLIRALDVDEFNEPVLDPPNGEWDRVYFSSNPADIAFGSGYTTWPTDNDWVNKIKQSGVGTNGLGYYKELNQNAFLGALSGNNDKWNTSVLTFNKDTISKIGLGDNYVGITIHHYFNDPRRNNNSPNTNWTMTVDWGQLVIDGGPMENGEISNTGISVNQGEIVVNTGFIPKVTGNKFSMEVNVIEKTKDGNGNEIERNLTLEKKYFSNSTSGVTQNWNNIKLTHASIDPSKEYTINIILFDDRGGGDSKGDSTNPGKAQHIVSISTYPKVKNFSKPLLQVGPTGFTKEDFQNNFLNLDDTPNGDNLQSVTVWQTAPEMGTLTYNGNPVSGSQVIPVNSLDLLQFIPNTGYNGPVSFDWNGIDSRTGNEAKINGKVSLNSAPTINNIMLTTKKGQELPLTNVFPGVFADPDNDSLSKVKIVTLPDPALGKLYLDNVPVVPGDEINAADLGKLKFVPEAGMTGTAVFTWNGSDGLQYANADKTVTIQINTPPVVTNITKQGGAFGTVVEFTYGDFSDRYRDDDQDDIQKVRITLPANFNSLGQLSVSSAVYATPGTSFEIGKADLGNLKFTPVPNLPEGTLVTFNWEGHDGQHYSNSANVTIAYNGIPVAQPQTVIVEEGTSPILIVLKGTDRETVTGLVYSIASSPAKGTLVPADPLNPNGDRWIYTPNGDFTGGDDSFTFTVTDEQHQTSLPERVTIRINKALDGWTGDKAQGDPTVVKAMPGEPLRLSAVSSLLANEVIAYVNGIPVSLVQTSATGGFKTWERTNYILPEGTNPGEYTVTFEAKKADQTVLPAEAEAKKADNKFEVAGAQLSLTANPDKIVGDGKTTAQLTAQLKDTNGQPIAGVEVVFAAPANTGTFIGSNRAVTDAQGNAVVTYQSAKITGINEQQIPITANVYDVAKGLSAKAEVFVTFQPAMIKGVITQGDANTPVANATVQVTLDLNGDGKIEPGVDFIGTVETDSQGAYSIAVPRGDATYDLNVTRTIDVGGVPTTVTYSQKAKVGVVTGSDDETFESEKTVTGIVLFQKADGQPSLLGSEVLNKTKVFLKDPSGNYIMENGERKTFDLSSQGVFNANGLSVGEYTLEVGYEIADGKFITISRSLVNVKANGEMNITTELVDPYGTIRDVVTKNVIEGATVTLYYADTERNGKNKSITPNTAVTLPALVGFEPNNNASPAQKSDAHGFYAYMVYPETDYYLIVEKDGYDTYRSPTLSVEWDIVKHDVLLSPVETGGGWTGGGYVSAPKPDVSLTISVDKNIVKENGESTVTVDYKNNSLYSLNAGEITVTLPKGAVLVEAGEGKVSGDTITWTIANLPAGQTGSLKFKVKWSSLTAAETEYAIAGQFKTGNGSSAATAESSVKIKVYSDNFGLLEHQRYILGYPDGQFKPNNSLTRAELAAIVARLTENNTLSTSLPFSDVSEEHWASNYIKIATKYGYFSGFEDGTFRPEAKVTRGELATVMARFLKLQISEPADAHFSDTAGHWAGAAVEQLYRGKFLSGYPDGTFKPNDSIIRVEAVTLINSMLYRGPLTGIHAMFPDVPETHWGFGAVQEATVSHEAARGNDGSEAWKADLKDYVQ
ncbi:S-layer homology domain-containing protein [Paenibacillus ginsengarvi]|uniref:S-layer homology domain-containing protein n=1 Tax=Paenibacillus ginsengarvi TaxID=400777 RepID=A0A3B0BNS5_9BACL|nr:S-layer homology domain-containing protein [Paenibacillus ginsengarvi]RKN74174.1 hypothetical protein D7M11_27380 [Paenibacillus ginsengarvi]